ncbi:Fur family transcriptional regulator [Thermophagus sp. OGC60D27]|uniref:Fur family transcriptional regulator n=1 Tax=Thermophagus sp. OGC60D27 TaxID=3458415 RepID=UPI004037CA7F
MVSKSKNIPSFLKAYGLSGTTFRKQVIELFNGEGTALTQKELEDKLPDETDRVTLYRTLKLFTEKGILHKIVIDDNIQKYKLAGSFKRKDHAHFYCLNCHKLFCMPQLEIDPTQLPPGFEYYSARLVVEGVCNKCEKKL